MMTNLRDLAQKTLDWDQAKALLNHSFYSRVLLLAIGCKAGHTGLLRICREDMKRVAAMVKRHKTIVIERPSDSMVSQLDLKYNENGILGEDGGQSGKKFQRFGEMSKEWRDRLTKEFKRMERVGWIGWIEQKLIEKRLASSATSNAAKTHHVDLQDSREHATTAPAGHDSNPLKISFVPKISTEPRIWVFSTVTSETAGIELIIIPATAPSYLNLLTMTVMMYKTPTP